MLANELRRRGVAALLLDQKPGTAFNPQANATQARTMEHYRRLGFADEIRALGMPADFPTDIAYFTRFAKHELARFRLPSAREARQLVSTLSGSWSAAELPHRVAQKFVEQVLRRHAERVASVHYGWRVTRFTDHGDYVEAEAEPVEGGKSLKIRSAYLGVADGARSIVRQAIGAQVKVEVLARDTWTAGHALVAERFGEGRVFIGGDAAHLFTPTGGLGYNTAVEDAVNLGWKLAAALQGRAARRLLESYEIERRPLPARNTTYPNRFPDPPPTFPPVPHTR